MYVLADLENCVFRHAHPDHSVIAALAHIEVAHCAVSIFPTERPADFPDFTDLEMRLLYQNTTGHKFEGFSRLHLFELLLETVRKLPESDVNAFEVKMQASKIEFKDSGFYRYVKGAYSAARSQTLFTPPAKVAQVAAMHPPS